MNLNIDFYTADELQLAADYLARLAAFRLRQEEQACATKAYLDSAHRRSIQNVKPTVTQNGGSSEPAATPSAGDPAGKQPAASGSSLSEAAGAVSEIGPAFALPPFDGVEDAQMAAAAEAKAKRKPRLKPKGDGITDDTAAIQALIDAQKVEEKKPDLSIDALRAALQAFTKENGLQAGGELLRSFGCDRLSELADKSDAVKIEYMAKAGAV